MIGLSTYAFFWQWHPTAERPLGLTEMIDRTAAEGLGLLQICDYPMIEDYDDASLAELLAHARAAGVRLELGSRGVTAAVLDRYLELARALDVTLVRSMLNTAEHRPDPDEAIDLLRSAAPAYERAGVALALETYEQVPVAQLVQIVAEVDSPALGICLDPGNCVAALELPADTVAATAPYVKNLHVKDFAFGRQDGWVGFTFSGCPLGEGLLDYDRMVDVVRPDERGINQIIEHWLSWQGDSAASIAAENTWISHNVHYLRSKTS